MTVSVLWDFFGQVLFAAVGLQAPFFSVLFVAFYLLLMDAPLPVFLLILSRTGIVPAISANLRKLTLVLVMIEAVRIGVFVLTRWRRSTPTHAHWPGDSLWLRFYQSTAWSLISDTVVLASMIAALLFLLALSRETGPARGQEPDSSRLVRRAAISTVVVRAITLLMVIGGGAMMYEFQRRGLARANITSASGIVRNALFEIPGLIAPWIVYVSVRTETQPAAVQPTFSIPEG